MNLEPNSCSARVVSKQLSRQKDTGVVSGAILLIKADPLFDMSTLEVEFVVSVTVGVACIFALLGGWLNKSIGRKLTIIISSAFFVLGSVILGRGRNGNVVSLLTFFHFRFSSFHFQNLAVFIFFHF